MQGSGRPKWRKATATTKSFEFDLARHFRRANLVCGYADLSVQPPKAAQHVKIQRFFFLADVSKFESLASAWAVHCAASPTQERGSDVHQTVYRGDTMAGWVLLGQYPAMVFLDHDVMLGYTARITAPVKLVVPRCYRIPTAADLHLKSA